MDIHVRDLRYFVAVAEELHFTRAAEQLFVSQPALSKQIRLLERQLGVALFERDRRAVRLSDAGAVLLPHARRVLAAWNDADGALARHRAEVASSLVVGMSTSPGRGLLPALRSRFRSRRPTADFELRQVQWDDPTAGLADRSCDLAFLWLPLPSAQDFTSMVIAQESLLVAMPAAHPLAARPELRVADLVDQPFLALPEEAGDMRDFWLLTALRPTPPRIGTVVRSAEETYEALVGGSGIVLVAEGNAPLVERAGVVTRPLVDGPYSRLALVWRRDDRREIVTDFVGACQEVIAAAGGTGRSAPA
ncbi:LysR family transcriptional regulator [Frankia sp. CNm7]|uniref:LysR family transcriptional regulator n=1 Tax=Frankia nepalensis TaxID=1836974 RepID=A0A937UNE6_9ACTN|nr:LysR substrate-binding domain-containing protein [Frankia nepalensis]MBL7495715.1 LysR family transcriptional regulator [Frankia nepalensis]MBL7508989.1 LysR family transcriptional regulator [Frankia nepalensis]MBL7520828.1 LysR family transcriptional regulator [Frankia nepalensis]MBL7629789.1 LysR family transcriptional regulator [Frankia nepalensis]